MKYKDLNYKDNPFGQPDIIEWLCVGQDRLAQKRKDEPLNVLRGGSTGAIIDDEVYGICHRKAYLRYNGINTPLEQEIELMTNQGEKNEEIWLKELQQGLPEHLYVMDQEQFECRVKMLGTVFSGSPDIVIFDRHTDKPVLGIENKNISSVSKAKSTNYEMQPDSAHLIQAANYSIRMAEVFGLDKPLPYQLAYSSRSIWHIFALSDKNKKIILKRPIDVKFNYGKPMTVQPFHRIFMLSWNKDGYLGYWTPGYNSPVVTKLNKDSISLYYDVVAHKIDEMDTLGPRPTSKTLDGKTSYSPCNYCDFKDICASNENMKPQEFKDRAKILCDELWANRNDHKQKDK